MEYSYSKILWMEGFHLWKVISRFGKELRVVISLVGVGV
jgi:hypothetical protein